MFTTLPTRTFLRSADRSNIVVHSVPVGRAIGGRYNPTFSRRETAAIFDPLGRDGGSVKIRDFVGVGGEDGELSRGHHLGEQAQRLRPSCDNRHRLSSRRVPFRFSGRGLASAVALGYYASAAFL